MIDNERILRSLRWVVPELEHRFNDCKNNLQPGSQGGYSDELKELIALKQELEQGQLLPETTAIVPRSFTLKECMDVGIILSLTLEESTDYYHQYNSQGWLKGNGMPIINLHSSMFQWKKRSQSAVKQGKGQSVADQVAQLKKGGLLPQTPCERKAKS